MTQRLIAIAAWCIVAGIVVATLSPLTLRPHLPSTSVFIERFAAYAIAGFCLGLAYPRRFFHLVILTIVMAFGLESMQQFAIDRHGQVGDAVTKAAGGLAGLFVAGIILHLSARRHR